MKIAFALLIAVLPSIAEAHSGSDFEQVLRAHQAETDNVIGEALAVEGPGFRWAGAIGEARAGEALTRRHRFRIASVTKPFTAAAILRLSEEGRLSLVDPIGPLISPESRKLLIEGGYDTHAITVRDLLSHSSGIYDYATDDEFTQAVLANPDRRWTRVEQVTLAMRNGKPYAPPGTRYDYSDTGYILLGEIIERLTGQPLGKAVRELLNYRRLGLSNTYWEGLGDGPTGAAPFAGNRYADVDLRDGSPSFDLFGGGGIISTVEDLARFNRALLTGSVFRKKGTLAAMLTVPGVAREVGPGRVHGNAVYDIPLGRYRCLGHLGFWGQIAAYCPEIDVTFAWTMNQGAASREAFLGVLERLAPAIDRQLATRSEVRHR